METGLRPGSLRQLIFFSFLLAMIPLAVLLWFSQNTLTKIGDIAALQAQQAVEQVRLLEQIKALSQDNERLIRQYHIVQKQELQELAANYLNLMQERTSEFCNQLSLSKACGIIQASIADLQVQFVEADEAKLQKLLAQHKQALQQLSQQAVQWLDQRLAEQQQAVRAMQSRQWWLVAILVVISLTLVLVNTQLLAKPVERLEQLIRAIATDEKTLPEEYQHNPTEFRQLDKQLRWLAKRLEELEQVRHALLRHASHELKTPLASMQEGCALLTQQLVGELNQQQREVVQLLSSSSDRLRQLVEQLLDYNQLMQQAEPEMQALPVAPIFNQLQEQNRLAIEQHQHQVEVVLEVDDIWVDERLFRRILDNLLSNALAHSPLGSKILLHLFAQADSLILNVANRGRQIPTEEQHKLFEPFYRGNDKRNDRVTGAGLGLSIVSDCARLMGGSVQLVEHPHMEVCLQVRLPKSAEAAWVA